MCNKIRESIELSAASHILVMSHLSSSLRHFFIVCNARVYVWIECLSLCSIFKSVELSIFFVNNFSSVCCNVIVVVALEHCPLRRDLVIETVFDWNLSRFLLSPSISIHIILRAWSIDLQAFCCRIKGHSTCLEVYNSSVRAFTRFLKQKFFPFSPPSWFANIRGYYIPHSQEKTTWS